MQEFIELKWQDKVFPFRPSFDLLYKVEERLSISELSARTRAASIRNVNDIPMTHLAWVSFCALTHAGAKVADPIEVQQAIMQGNFTQHGDVLGLLYLAFYGSGPEKTLKKASRQSPGSSTPRKKTLKNVTD